MSFNSKKLLKQNKNNSSNIGVGFLFTWGANTYSELGNGEGQRIPNKINDDTWISFSGGGIFHSAAIRSDGALFTWSNGGPYSRSSGQLGDGVVLKRFSPTQISNLSWNRISSGISHTAAIRSDGALFTWGANTQGQLGDNTQGNYKFSPIQIGTSSWTSVSCSGEYTAAIRSDGALFTWGANTQGQLGDGTISSRSSPIQIGTSSWISVDSGTAGMSAIRRDGALFSWGSGQFLGDGTVVSKSSPVQIGTSSWTVVSRKGFQTAAIRSDGRLFTWGRNGNGNLGDGTTIYRSSPVQVGTSSWTSVSCGWSHTAAIRNDGKLFTWGANNTYSLGALGDGTTISKSSPVQIGTSSWTSVNCGRTHTAAIRSDGALFTWGDNFWGQLGDGTTVNKSSPVQIGTSSWTSVGFGVLHSAAIRSDGRLFTWGDIKFGKLGDIDGFINSLTRINTPIQIGTSSWTSVSCGNSHTAAIRSDGALFTWGSNSDGMLGLGVGSQDIASASSPVQIGTSSWTSVDCGYRHTAAIRRDGALFTWGRNSANFGPQGTLGDGTNIERSSPVQIGTSSWISVNSGSGSTFAIRNDGALFAWGSNSSGKLGDGTTISRSSPVQVKTSSWVLIDYGYGYYGSSPVQTGSYSWTSVSSKGNHTLAIRKDGALFAWGDNNTYQLGLGDRSNRSFPQKIGTDSWTSVGTKGNASIALRSDGKLFAWGWNGRHSLGVLNSEYYISSPVQIGSNNFFTKCNSTMAIENNGNLFTWGYSTGRVFSNLYNIGTFKWNSISASPSHTAAIRNDGKLFTWGANKDGCLGDGSNILRSSPIQIGNSSWSVVKCCSDYRAMNTAAIRSDGALFIWGNDFQGQVGTGDFGYDKNKSSPVQIGNSSWIAVDFGDRTTVAIRSDGALFTWGLLSRMALGGVNSNQSPVQVGTSSWVSVAGGKGIFLAIRKDGALFAWGSGQFLGDGTVVSKSSPVQIGTSSWTIVSASVYHAAAIRSDGRLFTWGSNDNGQLGDGTKINRSSPVQIGNETWKSVDCGGDFTAAIRSDGRLFTWGLNPLPRRNERIISTSSPVQVGTDLWDSVSGGGKHIIALKI